MKLEAEIKAIKIPENFANQFDFRTIFSEELFNVRRRIVADALQGRAADGSPLKPYSRSYEEAIDSGLIQGKAPGNHTPNLTATGTLLRSMTLTPGEGSNANFEMRMFFDGRHPGTIRVKDSTANRKRAKAGLGKLGGISRAAQRYTVHGSGADQPNAAIAAAQYRLGRTGWMSFSKEKDIKRITARVKKELERAAKELFKGL